MAQFYIQARKGEHAKDYTSGTGAPTLTADSIALTFDKTTTVNRGDVRLFLQEIEKFLGDRTFPPV